MALTPEQRQAQLNRWKEGYIAAHPNLTPQQLASVSAIETLPDMPTYLTDTTLMRDDHSRAMNAAQEAQRAAETAATEAARIRTTAETWYRENVSKVEQLNTQLNNTTGALRAVQSVYEIPPEEMAKYLPGGALYGQAPPPAGGQPAYQQQPAQPGYNPAPSSSQTQFNQGHQPAAPVDYNALLEANNRTLSMQFLGAITERDAVAARHFELTGKMLNSSEVIAFMQANGVTDYTQAWMQKENISAIEATRAQEQAAASEAAIRADERAKVANSQLPSNPNPRFETARVLQLNQPVTPVDGSPVESGGHNERTRQVAGAYQQRILNRQAGTAGTS